MFLFSYCLLAEIDDQRDGWQNQDEDEWVRHAAKWLAVICQRHKVSDILSKLFWECEILKLKEENKFSISSKIETERILWCKFWNILFENECWYTLQIASIFENWMLCSLKNIFYLNMSMI